MSRLSRPEPNCPDIGAYDSGRLKKFWSQKISECPRLQEIGVNFSIFSPWVPPAPLFKVFIKDIQDLLPKRPGKIATENVTKIISVCPRMQEMRVTFWKISPRVIPPNPPVLGVIPTRVLTLFHHVRFFFN